MQNILLQHFIVIKHFRALHVCWCWLALSVIQSTLTLFSHCASRHSSNASCCSVYGDTCCKEVQSSPWALFPAWALTPKMEIGSVVPMKYHTGQARTKTIERHNVLQVSGTVAGEWGRKHLF